MGRYSQGILDAPSEEDTRHDDLEFDPQIEPKEAKAWLNLLTESETAFEEWNTHCDRIEKHYANLANLATNGRDKQFQMFWANCEVEKPTIYARAPQPVVVTKFKDRRPVPQAAAELLERCNNVAFDLAHIDELMKHVRDDLVLTGRGVAWCRYESGRAGGYYDYEKVCVDFKHRRDFLHSVSRTWAEVWWVAAASYLTREEARARFELYSGEEYEDVEYKVDRDGRELGGADARERAKFWEIWDKKHKRCVWVAEGCELLLDEDKAHLDLKDFFPCPKPAYGTTQPGSLVPVPDVLQYKDQLEELNRLTAKIHALTDALQARGFYPSGSSEIGDAINTALKTHTPGQVLVPISNWSAFGATKEVITWMPMAEIAQTINALVEIRKQIIQDIYEIKGLSDIMRGATDARETLGAQELKSQFGSTRVRDKQQELVRIARDLVDITSDIITEKFDETTIIAMSQTQLPTKEMQERELAQLSQQLAQQKAMVAQAEQMMQRMQQQPPPGPSPGGPPPSPMSSPGGPPGAPPGTAMVPAPQGPQGDPQKMAEMLAQAKGIIQMGEQAMAKIANKANFQQVMRFLRDNRSRAFVLDIETDSTIMIDENTEKQRRTEFTGVIAQLIPQLTQMMMVDPQTAPIAGEILKFTVAPYRAGRAMDGAIDDLVLLMEGKAQQPKGDDPTTMAAKMQLQIEQMKDATQQKKDQADVALKQQELKQKDEVARMKLASQEKIQLAKVNANQQDEEAEARRTNLEMMQSREQHQQKIIEGQAKIEQSRQKTMVEAQRAQLKMSQDAQNAQIKQADMAQRAADQRAQRQFKLMQPQRPTGPQGLPR